MLTRGVCSLRGALGPTACGTGALNGRLRKMRFGVQQQFIPLQTIRDARARAHSYGMSRIFGPQIVFPKSSIALDTRSMAESRAWPLMAWLRFAVCSTQAEVTLEGEDRNTRSLLRDMKKQTGLSEASMALRPPAHFPSDTTRDYHPSLLISPGITLLPF